MSEEEPSAAPTPKDGQCSFYLKKKNRFCRFRPNKDQKYCAEHSITMGVELERKRVVCPLNPLHTCYEDMLRKHIKKCNNRKKPEEVHYVEGINSGSDVEEKKVSFNSIDTADLRCLIEKINKLYDEYIGTIEEDILTHDCLKEELENSSYGTAAMRHRKQQASLVGHMNKLGLLQDNTRFIEMGAGKGQLSHWVERAVQDKNNISFLLVDRGSARYKVTLFFERLKIDIEHLDLDKVASIKNSQKENVAIGKHLCGAATDLALRCLLSHNGQNRHTCPESHNSEFPNKKLKTNNGGSIAQTERRSIKGVVIALCCHHRCTWKSYVGKEFIRSVNLTSTDFNIMSSMSSWATCTWKGWKAQADKTDNKQEEENKNIENIDDEHENNPQEDYRGAIKLEASEREEIGRRCKRLIDYGRLKFLQNNSFTVTLKSYIDFYLTPENIVLLAHR
ncbi:hypothetical protein LOTGIDRAFT_102700 [Lottia gigantea]|uniref:tRNA:m(4)X modification enzyme TRM13 n=1 Tax=Lottia gigantea TaxID=225164 RepID=V4BCT1_LOTGI|nr:hypothetical protein LOTGIDRAFT_102700 [Lottia gigantea]ESP05541.1 hypothetical protein LOTGIDRAFT_102700 [Lottia gigantea]